MIKHAQQYLNLKQAAEYLGINESTASRQWPGWKERFNVVPSKLGKRTLKFKRSDLDQMMEALKVQ